MKIYRNKIEGTQLLELTYNLTKGNKIRVPLIKGFIIKVNIKCFKDDYKKHLIEKIFEELEAEKPLKMILGNITLIDSREEKDNKLDLNLGKKDLIKEFIKKFAPKGLMEDILIEILSIQKGLK